MIKVLVADDDQMFCHGLKNQLLKAKDIQVVAVVRDGAACLEQAARYKPDVLLLDAILPAVDTLEILDALRGQARIIVLTSVKNPQLIQRAYDKGASDVMMKPCDFDSLIKRIRHTAQEQQPAVMEMFVQKTASGCKIREYAVEVTRILHQMGMPAHVKGYHYTREAVLCTIEDISLLDAVTKELYPLVAERFGTSASRVERGIRHAIELTWSRGNMEMMTRFFGYTINMDRGKPTNSEFIALLADHLILNGDMQMPLAI